MVPLQGTGLSHSEIRGSKVICTSPRLIAAYHVLHRLREPRHPPCALAYFPRHVTFLVTYTHIFSNMCGMTYTSCCLAFSGNWFILLLVTSCHRAFCVECAESDRVRGRPEGSPAPLYRETNISAVQGRKHHEDKVSPERRCSSRTFRYGYLVTT